MFSNLQFQVQYPEGILYSKKKLQNSFRPEFDPSTSPALINFVVIILHHYQEFVKSPDLALVKLDRKLESFQSHIRPICLATKDVDDKPHCPDNSRDRGISIISLVLRN